MVPALVAGALSTFLEEIDSLDNWITVNITGNQPFKIYFFIVSFSTVFRVQHSYGRYLEGRKHLQVRECYFFPSSVKYLLFTDKPFPVSASLGRVIWHVVSNCPVLPNILSLQRTYAVPCVLFVALHSSFVFSHMLSTRTTPQAKPPRNPICERTKNQ